MNHYTIKVQRHRHTDVGGWWVTVETPNGRVLKPSYDGAPGEAPLTVTRWGGFRLGHRVVRWHKRHGERDTYRTNRDLRTKTVKA